MGFRVHPNWCDKGIGTRILKLVIAHFAEAGIASFRLDVAEPNARAIRCYEKAGFSRTKHFDHNGIPFLWMELKTNGRPTTGHTVPPEARASDIQGT
jgi:RimJ/RimL family protein N-acetyltransferase